MTRVVILAALLAVALSGCSVIYCGPGAGNPKAKDMIRAFCTEL